MDPLVARLRSAGCVFAEDEAAALREAAHSPEELERMAVRRIAGEPLEQVLGYADFAGLRLRVAPGVFVPRLRSTLMVDLAAGVLPPGAVVIDLGCGTGAIGAAVAARIAGAEVWAIDIDPAAVACARLNLPADHVLEGDLFSPLPLGLEADAICANAPYVPTGAIATMPPEARDHEHRVALDGGADGLDIQRRLIAEAPDWLAPGGTLLVETSRQQAEATAALMAAAGLQPQIHTDAALEGTVVAGQN